MASNLHIEVIATGSAVVVDQGVPIRGYLNAISYEPDADQPLDSAVTLTVELVKGAIESTPTTMETIVFATKETILSVALAAAATWRPRVAVHNSSGAAISGLAEKVAIGGMPNQLRLTVSSDTPGNRGKFLLIFD